MGISFPLKTWYTVSDFLSEINLGYLWSIFDDLGVWEGDIRENLGFLVDFLGAVRA